MKSTANTSNHTIKATNQTIHSIVKDELQMLGLAADLNHIDVSEVTDMSGLFANTLFRGDVSRWNVSKVTDMSCMFSNSKFSGDLSSWKLDSLKTAINMFGRRYNDKILFGLDLSMLSKKEFDKIFY